MTYTTGAAWGVDGCKDGWFYFRLPLLSSDITFGVVTKLMALFGRQDGPTRDKVAGTDIVADGDQLLVDMPIGLPDRDSKGRKCVSRLCDSAARSVLQERHGSVFPVPVRTAMREFEIHRNAHLNEGEEVALRKAKGLVRPIPPVTAGIFPKIFEVDSLMRTHDRAFAVTRETHPEVCFWALQGKPMMFKKDQADGFRERVELLEQFRPGARATIEEARRRHTNVAPDDIVDAMACALIATVPEDELLWLPENEDYEVLEDEHRKLRREIVYACPDAVRRASQRAIAP